MNVEKIDIQKLKNDNTNSNGNRENQNNEVKQTSENKDNKKKDKKEKEPKKEAENSKSNDENLFSYFKLVVGEIKKVWKHEKADKLFCEEIDIGNGEIRKIASGLVGH